MIEHLWAMAEVPAGASAVYLVVKAFQQYQDNWYRQHPESWPSRMHEQDHDPDAVG